MKRFISFIVILFMLVGATSVSYAENEENDTRNTSFDTAMGLLNALGLIQYKNIETVDIDSGMKRGEFIVMVQAMLGYDSVDTETQVFHDVKSSLQVGSAASTLAQLGIITGDADGNFRPNAVITVNEAYKILCSALGYDVLVKGDDNPLGSYMVIAYNLKLQKGVNAVGELTKGQSYQLIYNALHADIVKKLSYGTTKSNYTTTKGINLLSEVFNVYEYNGIAYGVGKVNLNGDVSVGRNEALIGSNRYDCGSVSAVDFIGRDVHYYYSDDGDSLTLVYIYENKNEIIELSADMLFTGNPSYNRNKVYYTVENGKNEELDISEDVLVLYNNRVYNDFRDDVFVINNGNIVFIDNNGDAVVDVAIVKEYTSYVVKSTNINNGIIIGRFNKTYHTDVNSSSVELNIHDQTGRKYEFSDISNDYVVSIYESKDKTCIEMVIVTEALTGIVNEIRNDAEDCILMIGAKEYRVEKDYAEKLKDENADKEYIPFSIGREATFYIDAQNVIMGVVSKELSGTVYGYLCGAKMTTGLDESASVRLFTDKGKYVTYTLSSKIQLNGNRRDALGKVYTPRSVITSSKFVNGGDLINQVVLCYILGSEIINICTAIKDDEQAALCYYNSNTTDKYVHRWGFVGGEFLVDSDTIIFNIVNTNVTSNFQDGDIEIVNAYDLTTNAEMYATFYNVDNVKHVGVMVIHDLVGEGGGDKTAVVEKITKCLDNNNDTILKLYCYIEGVSYAYIAKKQTVKTTLENINFGDVVSIGVNNLSEITSISVKSTYSQRNSYYLPLRTAGATGSASDYDYLNVRVAYIKGDYMAVTADGVNTRGHKVQGGITIIDDGKQRIYSGSKSDLYSGNSLTDYENGSHLLLVKYYDSISQIIIYRD